MHSHFTGREDNLMKYFTGLATPEIRQIFVTPKHRCYPSYFSQTSHFNNTSDTKFSLVYTEIKKNWLLRKQKFLETFKEFP